MDDPFAEIKKINDALKLVFDMQRDDGTFIISEYEQLKLALENYTAQPDDQNFIRLLESIEYAAKHLKNKAVDFKIIMRSMDALSAMHNMGQIEWNKIIKLFEADNKFMCYRFKYSDDAPGDVSLIDWINRKLIDKEFSQLSGSELTKFLINPENREGILIRLKEHLQSVDDQFLVRIIEHSKDDFFSILKTRFNLYLTDEQIAQAIVKHLSEMIDPQKSNDENLTLLIDTINKNLTHGRSFKNLLNNKNVEDILSKHEPFASFLSNEMNNRPGLKI